MFRAFAVILTLFCLLPAAGQAQEKHVAPLKQLVESKLRALAQNAAIVDAIKAQNVEHEKLAQAEIDALDKQWRAETKAPAKPLIGKVLERPVSKFLAQAKKDAKGLYTEIFVMDNKGLNVGQSDVTSDYWQGDEDKWQKTFSIGANAVFVDKVEKDESTQQLQAQVSFAIVDPASKAVIGAITVGVNLDALDN